MNAITFSTGDYTAALSYANNLASASGGSVSSNANYWILVATGPLMIFIITILLVGLIHFGRMRQMARL